MVQGGHCHRRRKLAGSPGPDRVYFCFCCASWCDQGGRCHRIMQTDGIVEQGIVEQGIRCHQSRKVTAWSGISWTGIVSGSGFLV